MKLRGLVPKARPFRIEEFDLRNKLVMRKGFAQQKNDLFNDAF
jgi:hypothetical protein